MIIVRFKWSHVGSTDFGTHEERFDSCHDAMFFLIGWTGNPDNVITNIEVIKLDDLYD